MASPTPQPSSSAPSPHAPQPPSPQPARDQVLGVRLPTHPTRCGYFGDRMASFEHYLLFELDARRVGDLIERGFRYFGNYFFRPGAECCGACVPIRIPVARFAPSKSQRRVARRAQAAGIVVADGAPEFAPEKFALYTEHKRRFGGAPMDSEDDFHASFYGAAPCVREFTYVRDGRLLGVGLVTVADRLASSMYFFYGAEGARLSLGTYSILHELDFCRTLGFEHLYLGYYIADHRFMRYKANFRPYEVRVGGAWVEGEPEQD